MGKEEGNLPCGLLEYFQETAAVDTAPITAPATANFAASLVVLSWRGETNKKSSTHTGTNIYIL